VTLRLHAVNEHVAAEAADVDADSRGALFVLLLIVLIIIVVILLILALILVLIILLLRLLRLLLRLLALRLDLNRYELLLRNKALLL